MYNLAANENRARIKLAKLFKFPAARVGEGDETRGKRKGMRRLDLYEKIARLHIPQEISRRKKPNESRRSTRAQWREIAI